MLTKRLNFILGLLAIVAAGLAAALWFFAGGFSGARDLVEERFFLPSAANVVKISPRDDAADELPLPPAEAPAAAPEILTPAKTQIVAPPPLPAPPREQAGGAITRAGIIEATNLRRQTHLGAGFNLQENPLLNLAAAAKAKDMLDGQYFEHISPAGLGADHFADNAGYEYIVIGENLARGNYKNDAELVQAWMDSPGHRENILKKSYRQMGAAAIYGNFEGKNTWLAVQIFASPADACPRVDQDLAARIDGQKIALDDDNARQEALAAEIDQDKEAIKILQDEYRDLLSARASRAAIGAKLNELNAAVLAANQKVNDYNAQLAELRAFYARHKTDVETYNAQVAAFNACLAALE